MIVLAIVVVVVGLVLGLVGNLPTYTLDLSQVQQDASQIGAWASALNGYAPIVQLGAAIGILLGLKLALLGWHTVVFIYHQFWGSS